MPLLETLELVAKPWAKFYSKSSPTQAVVMFTHIAGMLGGGGLAIAADRAVWKARTASDDVRRRLLTEVELTHRPVIIGLGMSAVSGVLMTTADLETFATSPVWWGKMVAFGLLLANGAWLQSIERGAQKAPSTLPAAWKTLAVSSRLSYTLWFAVALGGVLLTLI
jgi:hypothetical protein